MGQPRRNFGLDVLRCAAILLVLANHAFLGFFVGLGGVAWEGRARMASLLAIVSIEWLFVLSGFLIGTMMIRAFDAPGTFVERTRSFWLRRWFRTVPNYYLFLLVNVAIAALGWHGPLHAGEFRWRYAIFAQNLVTPEPLPLFFNEAWSLALDEWFYLALPPLVGVGLLLRARPRDAFLLATVALIAVPTVLRWLAPVYADPLEWDHSVRRVTVRHLDATGWGVLAALSNRWSPGFWSHGVGWRAAAGCTAMALGILATQRLYGVLPAALEPAMAWLGPRAQSTFGLTLMAAGTFLALPWIARLQAPGGALRSGVERLSNYTYSVYLSHFPVLYLLAELVAPHADSPVVEHRVLAVLVVVWLALTLTLSAAVYHAFEKPVSDVRERFTRRVDASPFGPAPPP